MASPLAYSNLALVRPRLKSVHEQREAAAAERQAERHLKEKIDQTHRVLTKLEARAAAYGSLIKEMQRRKNALEARAERIEDRCLEQMHEARLNEVNGIRCRFTCRPAPPAVEVIDESAIPAEYLREKVLSSPDKIAIKAALARGEDVAGVQLTQKIYLIRK